MVKKQGLLRQITVSTERVYVWKSTQKIKNLKGLTDADIIFGD